VEEEDVEEEGSKRFIAMNEVEGARACASNLPNAICLLVSFWFRAQTCMCFSEEVQEAQAIMVPEGTASLLRRLLAVGRSTVAGRRTGMELYTDPYEKIESKHLASPVILVLHGSAARG